MNAAGWTISVIAILIVVAIAWNTFGGKEDRQTEVPPDERP